MPAFIAISGEPSGKLATFDERRHSPVMRMPYPGGKGGSGVVQQIVSLMPIHDRYIEPFVGGGTVLDIKRPARSNIAADIDGDVVAQHRRSPQPQTEYLVADAFALLPSLNLTRADLVYLDPPYHPETRSRRKIYKFEMDERGHERLLSLILTLPAAVMISGYRHVLYDDALRDWHRQDFTGVTRGGPRIESVWCNFKPGMTYHDTRFLGGNFRERERIKRKRDRWVARIEKMSAIDRAVIWESLQEAMVAIVASSETTIRDPIGAVDDVAGDIGAADGSADSPNPAVAAEDVLKDLL